jgi:hypothetical protein
MRGGLVREPVHQKGWPRLSLPQVSLTTYKTIHVEGNTTYSISIPPHPPSRRHTIHPPPLSLFPYLSLSFLPHPFPSLSGRQYAITGAKCCAYQDWSAAPSLTMPGFPGRSSTIPIQEQPILSHITVSRKTIQIKVHIAVSKKSLLCTSPMTAAHVVVALLTLWCRMYICDQPP